MPAAALARFFARLASASALVLLASCGDAASDLVERCERGTVPCGNGCMPEGAACCDDGNRSTSSYCPDAAGRGCRKARGGEVCMPPAPRFEASLYCCSERSSGGSFDCDEGSRHCGLKCIPFGYPCCAEGKSNDDCPWAYQRQPDGDPTCPTQGVVLCGYSSIANRCAYCPVGECCSFGGAGGPGFHCAYASVAEAPDVCTGGKSGKSPAQTPDQAVNESDAPPPPLSVTGTCGGCASDEDCDAFGTAHDCIRAVCGPDHACHCCKAPCTDEGVCVCGACAQTPCDVFSTCLSNVCALKARGNVCE